MFKLVALSGLGLVSAQTVAELCDALATNCGWSAWTNTTACTSMFGSVAAGTTGDTTGDSVACRLTYANMANASDATTQHNCAFAGPVGGGLCGVPKTGACRAIIGLCGTAQHADQAACETALMPLQFITGTKQGTAAGDEDSLECRVYHANVGAGADPQNHCSAHTSVGGPCAAKNVTANAWHHCAQLQGACSAASEKQYPDEVSCRNVFAVFADSPVKATNTNDKGSRQYHGVAAYAVSPADKTHCQHAGPTGGGLLGGSYDSWRRIAGMDICSTGMGMMFAGVKANVNQAFQYWNMSDLMTVVPPAASLAGYSQTSHTSGNTEACRIYHLTVAATGGSNLFHCAHGDVSGGTYCGDILANGCLIINTGCGNKAYNGSATACYAALGMLGAQNKTGNMSDAMPNDDSIYCRVYNGGRALVAKNLMNANDMDASCNKVMMIGGCGGAATNAPTMAPTKESGASTLVVSSLLAILPFFA